jgi:hypothetical protein
VEDDPPTGVGWVGDAACGEGGFEGGGFGLLEQEDEALDAGGEAGHVGGLDVGVVGFAFEEVVGGVVGGGGFLDGEEALEVGESGGEDKVVE